jgi:CheY-like chemotaxis protein
MMWVCRRLMTTPGVGPVVALTGGRTGTFDALSTSGRTDHSEKPELHRQYGAPESYRPACSVSERTNAAYSTNIPDGLPPPAAPLVVFNQAKVGDAIDNFFNSGGRLPPSLVPLFDVTGSNLANALSQLSGERPPPALELELLRSNRAGVASAARAPDLILIDLNMPRRNGREVSAIPKADEALKRSQSLPYIAKGYELSANCNLSKPVRLEEFEALVKSINDSGCR